MTQPSVPARVWMLERDRDDQAKTLEKHEERIDKAESRLDVLGTRVGMYAALGATVGGVLASAIAVAIVRLAFGS